MLDPRPGQILEGSDPDVGDALRIVVTAVDAQGQVYARSIAHRRRIGSLWESRLGSDGLWDLSRHDWREV